MSPAHRDREQYQRWHIRVCARCGRTAALAANWSDGPICRTCLDRAARTYGTCPGCRAERLLPGRDAAGAPACRDCTGITRNFRCSRCRSEGRLRAGLCQRCRLADDLAALLDDGTGRILPALVPLHDRLLAMDNPASGLAWINRPQPRALLAGLASGDLPLTHASFDRLPDGRTAGHLRDLLMECGVLPRADRQLLLFQRWLGLHLAGVADPGRAALLHRYATWHEMRALRAKAAKGPLNSGQAAAARRRMSAAGAFLAWLAERGVPLQECRQADLDEWAVEGRALGREARAFLIWSMRTGRMPALKAPGREPAGAAPAPMAQRARIAALRRLATDAGLPLLSRVAGSIMLLYAQPVSRIVRLTVEDVATRDGLTTLNLGDPPAHVPEPLAGLLLEYLAQRPNMTTATNPDSRWLFPGRRAGQPMHPSSMREAFHRIGISALRGRTAAIRQLVLQMPPPVVAQALGYHQVSISRIASQAGSPWSGYAAGDHSKPAPSPRKAASDRAIQTT